MVWKPEIPYNDLPPLPPATVLESRTVLKAVVDARTALAALDQAASRMINPGVLIQAIPLLEAQASSEIENIVTTTDDLFRFVDNPSEQAGTAVKETLRYRATLLEGFASLRNRSVTANTAERVCSAIHGRDMPVRNFPGTIIGDAATKAPIYTPPVGEDRIRALLRNWEQFINGDDDIDPTVVMAVAHYQFEAIHPFSDGNGRTGRILNILLLHSAGLLNYPVLYLSRYIIEHKQQYYALLLEVTKSAAWEEWILFMLEGIWHTATETLQKIDSIVLLRDRQRDILRDVLPSGGNADLLDVLFEQPYCRMRNVMERCGVSRQTARTWLTALVDAGILSENRFGRELVFINTEYLKLLSR